MTSNVYDIHKTYYEFGDLHTNNTNSEIYNNMNNKINKQKIFYFSSQNINNDINTTDESNIIAQRKEKDDINPYDTNYKKRNEEKIFMRSNSEKKFKKPLIKTQKSILFQKILEENNKDNNNYSRINYNSNNISLYDSNNAIKNNFIEFNKIRFVLTSNYGHPKFIGLTGIEIYNVKNEIINIETASSVGALPKDLKTIYNENDEVRIFENVFNNYNNTNDIEYMWVTKFNKSAPFSFIEIYFETKIKVSKIKIFNYNQRDKLEIGVRTMSIYLDEKFYKNIFIRQGTGEVAYDYINNNDKDKDNSFEDKNICDFGQIINFPLIEGKNNIKNNSYNKKEKIEYASLLYEQSYETPYLPCGEIIKFQFMNNYYKEISLKDELDILKYNDIGVNKIEIFDNEGKNMEINCKTIANCEMLHNDENKIILNGAHNDNNNNCLFYVFDKNISISYIKFYPLVKCEKDKTIYSLNSLQEIKIFCDKNIIFEGNLYLYHPTIILFTSDINIIKDINEKYLTKNIKNRKYKELNKENYISLVFH